MSEAPAVSRALAWKAPTSATLSTTSSVAVQREENRKYLIICNDGEVVVYLAVGQAAAVNKGIRLNPEGGSYEMAEELGNLCPHEVNAVATSGTPVLTIQEAM